MKDALGHGSNANGGTASVYHRGAFRSAASMSAPSRKLAEAAQGKAQAAMAKIDNGLHSGGINGLPPLERRHYEEIAATLATQGKTADPAAHSARVSAYANHLATTNPQFNRQRFIEAASGKGKIKRK
jgi:hypothetical protein